MILGATISANFWLAFATVLAAGFIAVQAWYARIAYVEAAQSRLLQSRLDACFESYDAAAALDAGLRSLAVGMSDPHEWPPRARPVDAAQARALQRDVVPLINALDNQLVKASILGPLEKQRAYLVQHAAGLGRRLMLLDPAEVRPDTDNPEVGSIFASLSELIGAQYLVFAGCQTVAERKN